MDSVRLKFIPEVDPFLLDLSPHLTRHLWLMAYRTIYSYYGATNCCWFTNHVRWAPISRLEPFSPFLPFSIPSIPFLSILLRIQTPATWRPHNSEFFTRYTTSILPISFLGQAKISIRSCKITFLIYKDQGGRLTGNF